jgi:hypothetical protein
MDAVKMMIHSVVCDEGAHYMCIDIKDYQQPARTPRVRENTLSLQTSPLDNTPRLVENGCVR